MKTVFGPLFALCLLGGCGNEPPGTLILSTGGTGVTRGLAPAPVESLNKPRQQKTVVAPEPIEAHPTRSWTPAIISLGGGAAGLGVLWYAARKRKQDGEKNVSGPR